ncbi:MAG TPA: LacI family DNA-binding transcriptional regulator [Opitutus sp.]|nr:LacI family DNA-binding transcriptional regulator [Opitutus sp.]
MASNNIGKPIVTQQMIADAVGVHLSTVSLALRNDPRLPPATRQRVHDAAKRLGYSPNPLVSLLLSRVRRRSAGYRGTLGFLHTMPEATPRLRGHVHRNYLKGARRRAAELGYNIDEFFLSPQLPPRRLLEMLHTRNITGLIVSHMASPLCPNRTLPFEIDSLAAVCLGVPLANPQIHYVANDQYMRAVLAAREVLALGYRRLGLALGGHFDSAMSHRCSAGFWAVQEYTAGVARIPICHGADESPETFRAWLEEHQPDVVLGTHPSILELLQKFGRQIPDDLGWVHLDWLPEYGTDAGIHGNSSDIGAAAVELVVSQMHRGEFGPPARAMNYFVSGTWHRGKTVRRVGPPLDLDTFFFADLLRA